MKIDKEKINDEHIKEKFKIEYKSSMYEINVYHDGSISILSYVIKNGKRWQDGGYVFIPADIVKELRKILSEDLKQKLAEKEKEFEKYKAAMRNAETMLANQNDEIVDLKIQCSEVVQELRSKIEELSKQHNEMVIELSTKRGLEIGMQVLKEKYDQKDALWKKKIEQKIDEEIERLKQLSKSCPREKDYHNVQIYLLSELKKQLIDVPSVSECTSEPSVLEKDEVKTE